MATNLPTVDDCRPDLVSARGVTLTKQFGQTFQSEATPTVHFCFSCSCRDAKELKQCGADDFDFEPIVTNDFLRTRVDRQLLAPTKTIV